jgi:predicted metal-binding membrane protein
MAWMPMCGETWFGAAASFVGMWAVMMVAMMLPSLAPMLWRYSLALQTRREAWRAALTAFAAAGYFAVWTVLGGIVFAGGAAFAESVLQMPPVARAVPVFLGLVLLLAGAFQFSAWKAHHLARCRPASRDALTCTGGEFSTAEAGTAWRYGVWLGLQCSRACAGLTCLLLVIGVMDLLAMALVMAAVTAERLAPAGEHVAWVLGGMSVVAGMCVIGHAAWL